MLRSLYLAIVLSAFAGAALAECGAAHDGKEAMTTDKAQATKAPVAKSAAALSAPKKQTIACDGGNCNALRDGPAANKKTRQNLAKVACPGSDCN